MAEDIRRIIHVKGSGYATQAPDKVIISITLEAQDKDYSQAVGLIADKIAALRKSVTDAGFDTNELITESFSVKKIPIMNILKMALVGKFSWDTSLNTM